MEQGMGNTSKAVPTGKTSTPTPTATPTMKAAPAVTEVKKMDMNKANMEKAIAEKKGLRTMTEMFGESIYQVKKALKEFGLKTASMREGAGKSAFPEQFAVFTAIQNGAGDEIEIAAQTKLGVETVKAIVRRFKKDGTAKQKLTVVTPSTTPNVA